VLRAGYRTVRGIWSDGHWSSFFGDLGYCFQDVCSKRIILVVMREVFRQLDFLSVLPLFTKELKFFALGESLSFLPWIIVSRPDVNAWASPMIAMAAER
jgi:hypothetical protein